MKLLATTTLLAFFTTEAFRPDAFRPTFDRRLATAVRSTVSAGPSVLESVTSFGIVEPLAQAAAAAVRSVEIPVPSSVSPSLSVDITYIKWDAPTAGRGAPRPPPVLLVHGFDSSCLEYRRLGPELAARSGADVYAVDLLGWGFTTLDASVDYSAASKLTALRGFWDAVDGRPVVLAGASLGGASAILFGAESERVLGTVLIDAQGFVDGVGPMASLPGPLAFAGVSVLKSVPLRNAANKMSYADPDTFATEDALRVGRVHCVREGWDAAMVSFMKSGGFAPSAAVEKLADRPVLILWGRQDGILDGTEFVPKFEAALGAGSDVEVVWVEDSGHVPHLEQPETTADIIAEFLTSDKFLTSKEAAGAAQGESNNFPTLAVGVSAVAAAGLAATLVGGGIGGF
mmetsp:Transcript_14344/g.28645  ORF Transcript_14344/g.28645 Transcript_14344/m.28645 type:complete len:401 (+) Transcript_14344:130-1332(+)